jgi:hypothetical protein
MTIKQRPKMTMHQKRLQLIRACDGNVFSGLDDQQLTEMGIPMASVRPIAEALNDYLRFRAEQEGVGYELSAAYLAEHILLGCVKFFGVTFENGQLVADEEQPELFRRWQTRH